ncbi:hypothetical protein C8J56DRAFT_1076012 [Mycena floridula]|nr:hypothetical protein C8J56DRAFT_1076012 [Mycena floridula]
MSDCTSWIHKSSKSMLSLMALGGWIRKKWIRLEQREKDAEKKWVSIGLNEALLRQEWVDQVKHQTKALPRQSKNAGKLAINQILDLKDCLDGEQEDLHRLQTLDIDEDDFLDPAEEIAAANGRLNVVAPHELDKEGLFQLDVDNNIWDDIGLNDEFQGVRALPGWLADDNVHEGIRVMLELDRCSEERERLLEEKENLKYFACLQADTLANMCVGWQKQLQIFEDNNDEDWGPSLRELMEARSWMYTAHADKDVGVEHDDEDEEDQDIEMKGEMGENLDDYNDEAEGDEFEFLSEISYGLEIAG